MPELALGTVQFGLAYGVSNTQGQLPRRAVAQVLADAARAGLRVLDTAHAYGESEQVLGESLPSVRHDWRVITKLPPGATAASAAAAFGESLRRLRSPAVYGLMSHRASDLVGQPELVRWLLEQRSRGQAVRVGVSVYSPQELESLDDCLGRGQLDLVQLPANLYDQRMHASGWLDRLRSRGVEVHARSLFLQGLLLVSPQQMPAHFAPWRELHGRYWRWREEQGRTPVAAALGYGLGLPLDALVLGLHDPAQLEEWLAVSPWQGADVSRWATTDERLYNPVLWKQA